AAESRPMPTTAPVPVPTAPRLLWQLPAFLLGAAALAAVAFGRPYWRPADADRITRDLRAARSALEHAPPDPEAARDLCRRALSRAEAFPPMAAEAHFLLGSALAALAESAPANEASDLWREAREHLEQADEIGPSEADRP